MANTHTTLTSLFTDIANKIRLKKGTTASIKADDFPSEIESIQTGITPSGSQTFTENGTYDVTAIAQAIVNVSGGGELPTWLDFGELNPQADYNLSDTHRYTISHNLGVTPIAFLLFDIGGADAYTPYGGIFQATHLTYNTLGNAYTFNSLWRNNNAQEQYASPFRVESRGSVVVSDTTIEMGVGLESSTATYQGAWLLGDHRYIWIAIAEHTTQF